MPAALKPTAEITIALWYRATTVDGSDPGSRAAAELVSGSSAYILRLLDTDIEILKRVQEGTGINYARCYGPLANPLDGQWHHVAGVSSPAGLKVYIDGVEKCSNTEGQPITLRRQHQGPVGRPLPRPRGRLPVPGQPGRRPHLRPGAGGDGDRRAGPRRGVRQRAAWAGDTGPAAPLLVRGTWPAAGASPASRTLPCAPVAQVGRSCERPTSPSTRISTARPPSRLRWISSRCSPRLSDVAFKSGELPRVNIDVVHFQPSGGLRANRAEERRRLLRQRHVLDSSSDRVVVLFGDSDQLQPARSIAARAHALLRPPLLPAGAALAERGHGRLLRMRVGAGGRCRPSWAGGSGSRSIRGRGSPAAGRRAA